MKTLHAYYESYKVGTLRQDDDLVYSFSYDSDWLKNPQTFPLSLALPLSEKVFGNKLALSFFENLLPEGEVRENLKRHENISSTYDFLKLFGRDCAGAIVILDEGDNLIGAARDEQKIDLEKIYSAIEQHASVAEVLVDMNNGYLSLAGAQDKFPVIYREGELFIPGQSAPTTHIVKVPIWRSGIKESVYNEYFCMELARSVGLPIPRCEIIGDRYPLFLIERYDRRIDDQNIVQRLHQQDFCQAQGVPSEQKYESKGGPSLKDNYELILNNSPVRARLANLNLYLDWIAFNLIIGNNDSHSKNISLLLKNNANELAPMYDLLCTAIYPTLTRDFSFRIGDRSEFSKIGKRQIELMEVGLGLKKGTFQKRLSTMSETIIGFKDRVAIEVLAKHAQVKIIPRINALIDDRIKSLRIQGAIP